MSMPQTQTGQAEAQRMEKVRALSNEIGRVYQDVALTTPCTAAGQSVAGLYDLSGNGRHLTQATLAAQPTLQFASMPDGRSLAVLGCDGGDRLQNLAPGALLRNVGGATLIVVCQGTTPGTERYPIHIAMGGGVSTRAALIREGTGTPTSISVITRRVDGGAAPQYISSGGLYAAGEWSAHIAVVDFIAATARLYHNGVLVGENLSYGSKGLTSDTDSYGYAVGDGVGGGWGGLVGQIAEIVVCGAVVGATLLLRYLHEYLRPATGIVAIT